MNPDSADPGQPISILDTDEKVVALTFDDGPDQHTQDILHTLTDAGAGATFFVVGSHVDGREQEMADLVDAGMSVQWHTQTHPDLATLPRDQAEAEIAAAADVLEPWGISPTCVRPPMGSYDDTTMEVADELGQSVVGWTIDTRDWESPDPDVIVDRVMDQLEPGAIVLLHDGGGDRSATVEALPDLLEELGAARYQTVALCEG